MSETAGVPAADALGRLLGALASRPGPLPKYLYPSAGTLYPVQTYLLVPAGGVDGLAEGVFYYDPDRHALARVADRAAVRHCTILLAEEPAAIEPIYGDSASDFSLLEAGYMAEVLAEAAVEAGLSLSAIAEVADFQGYPGLSPQNILLAGWICAAEPEPLLPQADQHRTHA
jgi:hypothetical protein